MISRKKKRLYMLAFGLLGLGAATALSLNALDDNLVFFRSPSDIKTMSFGPDQYFRLGGLVEEGSLKRGDGELTARFRITDGAESVSVTYSGVLPDLFREGQGVIAQGRLDAGGVFVAEEVLAKHDENYMPPEVSDALKRAGQWQDGENYNGHGESGSASE